MRPKLGTTVYCRRTGKPWTVADVDQHGATVKSQAGAFVRWSLDRFSARRPYRPRRRTAASKRRTPEVAVRDWDAETVRLAANLGLSCEVVAWIRGTD